MDELYKTYGELMVKQEILQNQINEVKKQINTGLAELQTGTDQDEEVDSPEVPPEEPKKDK